MTLDERRFTNIEVPKLLNLIGDALDALPQCGERTEADLIQIRVELDRDAAEIVRRNLKGVRKLILEAATAHLLYRDRDGNKVSLELYDTGMDLDELFRVTAAVQSGSRGDLGAQSSHALTSGDVIEGDVPRHPPT